MKARYVYNGCQTAIWNNFIYFPWYKLKSAFFKHFQKNNNYFLGKLLKLCRFFVGM